MESSSFSILLREWRTEKEGKNQIYLLYHWLIIVHNKQLTIIGMNSTIIL